MFVEMYDKFKKLKRQDESIVLSVFRVSKKSVLESGETRRYGGTLFRTDLNQGFSCYGRPELRYDFGEDESRKSAYAKLADGYCNLRPTTHGLKYLAVADRMKDAGIRFSFVVYAMSAGPVFRALYRFDNLTRAEKALYTRISKILAPSNRKHGWRLPPPAC